MLPQMRSVLHQWDLDTWNCVWNRSHFIHFLYLTHLILSFRRDEIPLQCWPGKAQSAKGSLSPAPMESFAQIR